MSEFLTSKEIVELSNKWHGRLGAGKGLPLSGFSISDLYNVSEDVMKLRHSVGLPSTLLRNGHEVVLNYGEMQISLTTRLDSTEESLSIIIGHSGDNIPQDAKEYFHLTKKPDPLQALGQAVSKGRIICMRHGVIFKSLLTQEHTVIQGELLYEDGLMPFGALKAACAAAQSIWVAHLLGSTPLQSESVSSEDSIPGVAQ